MTSTPVETAATVLVLSAHASFRAHVDKWLPAPAVNVVASDVATVEQRIKESPPQLLIIDKQLDQVSALLSRLAVMIPGVPYLIVSTEHLDPDNPYLFDISSGFVAAKDEFPTRESVIAAIQKVAPNVAARLK
jgi:hypothetical protein